MNHIYITTEERLRAAMLGNKVQIDKPEEVPEWLSSFGKPWVHPRTGGVRIYLQEKQALELACFEDQTRGNGSSPSALRGQALSSGEAVSLLRGIAGEKIWLDASGRVCGGWPEKLKKAVQAAIDTRRQ